MSHPGDGQGHVEVFASLQPEAPWCRSWQGYCVIAHFEESLKWKSSSRISKVLSFLSVLLPVVGMTKHPGTGRHRGASETQQQQQTGNAIEWNKLYYRMPSVTIRPSHRMWALQNIPQKELDLKEMTNCSIPPLFTLTNYVKKVLKAEGGEFLPARMAWTDSLRIVPLCRKR